MIKRIFLVVCTFFPALTYAASLQITVEVPKQNVAEYHAPYTAIWLESVDRDIKFTKTLAVWYDLKKKNNEGQKWLKDLRQWWRRDGRDLQMPVDGVASATRLVGVHQLNFILGQAPLVELPKGSYILFVEMSREVGGRELVQVPFTWPVDSAATLTAKGTSEVGVINLVLNP
jgi:hypothetical protein